MVGDSAALDTVPLPAHTLVREELFMVYLIMCRSLTYAQRVSNALERAGMLEQVGSIDLTHSTWISMVYRERFEARIPLDKDLDHSLGVLALAVEHTVQPRGEQAAGIMDLTQEEYDAAFTPASG